MYLRKLELLGFKSFADRTEFVFQPGLTGIVGPNGCGKSNVVDAFKWIFGEQSAKGLRGSEMKDVIFNGTQTRSPQGFAEVTIVFDNSDGFLKIDYTEVSVTRRLFRSGESEYLINKQKCRLKDIKELFLDTGIGTTSYSILEQGKIDVLLQASTLDRRIIFEEAAGISKYRVKKAEALRALLRVEENLKRLQDIIDEVEKRIHRVKVQAGRARKYREYSERLKELRVRIALEDYTRSVEARAEISFGLFWASHRAARLEDLAGRLSTARAGRAAQRQELDREIEDLREKLAVERIGRERSTERLESSRRRLLELGGEGERKREELAATRESLEKLRRSLEAERGQLEGLEREIAGHGERLASAGAELERLQGAHRGRQAELEARREAVVALIQKRSRIGNLLVQVTSEMGNLASRRERLETSMASFRAELENCEARAGLFGAALETCAGQEAALEARRQALDEEMLVLGAQIQELEDAQAARQAELHRQSSRYEVLRSFEENLDGIVSGVAEVLRRREELPPLARSHGLLGSLLRVERRYARAVEAALGPLAQALVTETQDGALELLDFVRSESLGGIEVIPLERVAALPLEYFPRQGGVLGPLRQVVDGPPELRELLDRLLADNVLVEDFPTALALARNGLRKFRLVTLAGEILEPWGAISSHGEIETGIISRQSEMEEVLAAVRELEKECEHRRQELASRRRELGARGEDLEAQRAAIEEIRRSIASVQGELAQNARDAGRFERELKVGSSEAEELRSEIEKRRVEKAAREEELETVDAERARTEEEVREREAGIAVSLRELEESAGAVAQMRLELARAEKEQEGLRELVERQTANVAEREKHVADLVAEMELIAQRSRESEEAIVLCGRELEAFAEREKELALELESREEADRALEQVEAAFRSEIEKVRAREMDVRREREELQLRDQEERHRRNTVLERIDEEYGIDLKALLARGSGEMSGAAGQEERGDPAPEAVAAGSASPGDERFLAPLEGWDRDAARQEAKELQEKIRHLGNVNLDALDELEELEQRFGFQMAQKSDLVESERNLRGIIAEINRKSREMFQESFSKVQENFSDLFRKCFGGGKAELILEEGVDILDAGIEIVARPPGKKLTSLTLMSGGEKTMTTIALLLAIFRSRPSPFCVLDEVDAPLDETNVRRFIVLLEDFVKQSQFIIITHNKVTMAQAGMLYGVTMEERGVSKKVAVELATYDPEGMEAVASSQDSPGQPFAG
jgi:chromosome segregation protein